MIVSKIIYFSLIFFIGFFIGAGIAGWGATEACIKTAKHFLTIDNEKVNAAIEAYRNSGGQVGWITDNNSPYYVK